MKKDKPTNDRVITVGSEMNPKIVKDQQTWDGKQNPLGIKKAPKAPGVIGETKWKPKNKF